MVDDLEMRGIVEPSRSAWLNAVVFSLDFRRLNELIRQEELPNIQNLLANLGGYEWFTVVDLEDGFFNIETEDRDKEKQHSSQEQG